MCPQFVPVPGPGGDLGPDAQGGAGPAQGGAGPAPPDVPSPLAPKSPARPQIHTGATQHVGTDTSGLDNVAPLVLTDDILQNRRNFWCVWLALCVKVLQYQNQQNQNKGPQRRRRYKRSIRKHHTLRNHMKKRKQGLQKKSVKLKHSGSQKQIGVQERRRQRRLGRHKQLHGRKHKGDRRSARSGSICPKVM